MKKLLFALLGSLLSASLFAQMMPDSTYQIVAYWDKGDQVSYECKSKSVRILPDGTEVVQSSSSDTRTFEVIDQTDTSYTLRMTYADAFLSQLNLGPEVSEAYARLMAEQKIDILTDQLGTVQGFLNLDQVLKSMEEYIPIVFESVLSKFNEKDVNAANPFLSKLKDSFIAMFTDRDKMRATYNANVSPFFFYHGARLDPKEEYVIEQEYPNVMGVQGLKADLHFWVDEEESDSVSVVIYSHAEADEDAMLSMMLDAALTLLRNTVSPEQYEEAAPAIILSFDKSNMSASFVAESGTIIDLGSGWPVWYNAESRAKIEDKGGNTEVVSTTEISYKDPEEP